MQHCLCQTRENMTQFCRGGDPSQEEAVQNLQVSMSNLQAAYQLDEETPDTDAGQLVLENFSNH